MKYALTLASAGKAGDARTQGELAHVAEESGWDGVFLEDYIVWQGHTDVPSYDPWIALAAMAMRTTSVLLGTTVTPLPRRRPWKVAQEMMTLDHLSNGRMILGVGIGDAGILEAVSGEIASGDVSFSAFGEVTNPKRRAEMLDQALDILTLVWRGEPFSYEGQDYKIHNARVLPVPVQKPRIPIWVGGGFPLKGPTQRAARYDGAILYKHQEPIMTANDVCSLAAMVQSVRGSLDGYEICTGGNPRGEDWGAERDYIRELREAGMTWWDEYIPPDTGDFEVIRKLVARGPIRVD